MSSKKKTEEWEKKYTQIDTYGLPQKQFKSGKKRKQRGGIW